MKFIYDESYYTRNNYAGYLQRAERYEKLVQELEYELFRVLKLDFKSKPVLDFGCGVGYVVHAMESIGYKDVFGYDLSAWATNWGKEHLGVTTISANDFVLHTRRWELMTAFDVFEHMEAYEIARTLLATMPEYLLVRIPLVRKDGGKFVLEVSENDPTHITRFTRETWLTFFENNNYKWLFNVNLGTFYDTEGVMCAMLRHDYAVNP